MPSRTSLDPTKLPEAIRWENLRIAFWSKLGRDTREIELIRDWYVHRLKSFDEAADTAQFDDVPIF